jgi:hypothetical protein
VAPNRNITIPDLRDRFIFSKGTKTFGAKAGEENHLLTSAESGQKTLPGNVVGDGGGTFYAYGAAESTPITDHGVAAQGLHHGLNGASSAANSHNNMPPYCVLALLIKATMLIVDGGTLVGPPGPTGPTGPPGIRGQLEQLDRLDPPDPLDLRDLRDLLEQTLP